MREKPKNHSNRHLASLQFETTSSYDDNLSTLCTLCKELPDYSIAVAPEVCVTGFDYEHFHKAAHYATIIDEKLLEASSDKTIITTMIVKEEGHFYNRAKVYHNGSIIHEQDKYKLFTLGDETRYFSAGDENRIINFSVDGISMAILICFEIRFSELWQKIRGVKIIAVPAQWGKIRTDHFVTLTKALAISNQAYVIASDAANVDTTSKSAIISPFGETFGNEIEKVKTLDFQIKEVKKMRKYINIGL